MITERTKAIIVVHYAGVGWSELAYHDIAIGTRFPSSRTTLTDCWKVSGKAPGYVRSTCDTEFPRDQELHVREGGALLINDPAYIERAEILREKGTIRSRFFRGQVDKYSWVDLGSSYLPSDMLAAHLFAQLECWQRCRDRQRVWETYYSDAARLGGGE